MRMKPPAFSSPDSREPSLCLPGGEKSCFACCPPIRTAGYEHIQYRTMVQRVLRENTCAFDKNRQASRPITGFSCWALGYLDSAFRQAGCLLHPARNGGKDFRHLTGYGEKCRRESCPEARLFQGLSVETRRFWLHLTRGLDTLQYSSRRENPLFHLMGWGEEVLEIVASNERGAMFSRDEFFRAYPFFHSKLSPRANAYLLQGLLRKRPLRCLKNPTLAQKFERFSGGLIWGLKREFSLDMGARHTHLLDLDPLFLNLLRIGAGIRKIREDRAQRLKEKVDRTLDEFVQGTWP